MSLTAVQVKEAKPLDKDQKLSDGESMYLLVKVNGKKYWRMDYPYDTPCFGAQHHVHLSGFKASYMASAFLVRASGNFLKAAMTFDS